MSGLSRTADLAESNRFRPDMERLESREAPAAVTLPEVRLPRRSIDVHTHFGPFPWDVPHIEDPELMPLLARRVNAVGAVESCVLAIAA